MSDITTNNNGSQDDNQKTTPVTESLFELNNSSTISLGGIFHTWLPCTLKFEPISSKARKLSPAACAGTPALAPPEKPPFDSFFE
ncbi:MAG: hypothetical protein WBK76_01860, partial [Candidatus Saccharimonadales bacterium]